MTDFTNEPKSTEPTIVNEEKHPTTITNETESGTPARFNKAKFDKQKFDRGRAGEGTTFINETKH